MLTLACACCTVWTLNKAVGGLLILAATIAIVIAAKADRSW